MRSKKEHIAIIEGIVQVHDALPPKRQWQSSYIRAQVEKREKGLLFTLQDHVQAMVYSLLSAETPWERIEGNKPQIDKLFLHYDPEMLMKKNSADLVDELEKIKCGGRIRGKQMEALKCNIETLKRLDEPHGGIDAHYAAMLTDEEGVHPYEKLLLALARTGEYKLAQMGIPLVAEYLRNVGHNISKPDRHVMRLLDQKHLSEHHFKGYTDGTWSDKALLEGLRIIRQYAEDLQLSEAYIDHLMWSYCAVGYGQICTKENPRCEQCKIRAFCLRN